MARPKYKNAFSFSKVLDQAKLLNNGNKRNINNSVSLPPNMTDREKEIFQTMEFYVELYARYYRRKPNLYQPVGVVITETKYWKNFAKAYDMIVDSYNNSYTIEEHIMAQFESMRKFGKMVYPNIISSAKSIERTEVYKSIQDSKGYTREKPDPAIITDRLKNQIKREQRLHKKSVVRDKARLKNTIDGEKSNFVKIYFNGLVSYYENYFTASTKVFRYLINERLYFKDFVLDAIFNKSMLDKMFGCILHPMAQGNTGSLFFDALMEHNYNYQKYISAFSMDERIEINNRAVNLAIDNLKLKNKNIYDCLMYNSSIKTETEFKKLSEWGNKDFYEEEIVDIKKSYADKIAKLKRANKYKISLEEKCEIIKSSEYKEIETLKEIEFTFWDLLDKIINLKEFYYYAKIYFYDEAEVKLYRKLFRRLPYNYEIIKK